MKNSNVKILAIALLVLISTITFSQTKSFSNQELKLAERNSISALESDVNSLVESAIFNMIIFKDRYPEWNYGKITNKLNELSVEGRTLPIRYKAQLASMFINNPAIFADIKIIDKYNPGKYFKIIAERVENTLVATN